MDDEFYESFVKKRRCDDMEGHKDSSACATVVTSIANEKKK